MGTLAPPDGAAPESVRVHSVCPLEDTDDGEAVRLWAVTVEMAFVTVSVVVLPEVPAVAVMVTVLVLVTALLVTVNEIDFCCLRRWSRRQARWRRPCPRT